MNHFVVFRPVLADDGTASAGRYMPTCSGHYAAFSLLNRERRLVISPDDYSL